MSRHGLECPGDTIPYNCLIQSNSEALHLIWHLTFPDSHALIEIIFNGSSTSLAHETRLNGYINASLIGYTEDMYIESSLVITVHPNASMNQLFLQCLIEDLGNDSSNVLINSSSESIIYHCSVHTIKLLCLGPLLPTNITRVREFHDVLETTITLTWNVPPQDGGPAAVVDNYTISTYSTSMSFPTNISVVPFPPLNVTLSHNTWYNITIIATNCAGESEPAALSNILIRKWIILIII